MTVPDFGIGGASAAQLNVLVAAVNALTASVAAVQTGAVNLQSATPNMADFSGAMADWVTGITVAVPTWAQDGAHHADLLFTANPTNITTVGKLSFRVVVASTAGPTVPFQPSTVVGAQYDIAVPHSQYLIPASTSTLAVKVQAAAAAGAIRFNTSTGAAYSLLCVFS